MPDQRFEDWLRQQGAYPQGATIRGPELIALADLVLAVRHRRRQAAWMREHLGDHSTVATQAAMEYERATEAEGAALAALDEANHG